MCTGMEILSMIGTAASAVGSVQQGRQQKAAYDYQAQQAELDARDARDLAALSAGKIRKAGAKQRSQAIAALAASGVDVGAGSALRIDQQIAQDAELDAQMELLTGASRSASSMAQASGYRAAGKNAQQAGFAGAGRSLLSGAAQMPKAGWIRTNDAAPYSGTWTANGPLDSAKYDKQIYD